MEPKITFISSGRPFKPAGVLFEVAICERPKSPGLRRLTLAPLFLDRIAACRN